MHVLTLPWYPLVAVLQIVREQAHFTALACPSGMSCCINFQRITPLKDSRFIGSGKLVKRQDRRQSILYIHGGGPVGL